jgi:hypothetical protein
MACVYMLTAICEVNGTQTERWYWGVFRIYANQSKDSAAQARLAGHRERPVAWLRAARADTMTMRSVGHPMSLGHALLEEAVQAARALSDGGAPCRGGPWAHPKINSRGLAEAAEVRRLTANAETANVARAAVLTFAEGLGDASYLKRHCLNSRFRRDSGEAQMGPPRQPRRRASGQSQPGNVKRQRLGLRPGTYQYKQHKWGADVVANRRRDNQNRHRAALRCIISSSSSSSSSSRSGRSSGGSNSSPCNSLPTFRGA